MKMPKLLRLPKTVREVGWRGRGVTVYICTSFSNMATHASLISYTERDIAILIMLVSSSPSLQSLNE